MYVCIYTQQSHMRYAIIIPTRYVRSTRGFVIKLKAKDKSDDDDADEDEKRHNSMTVYHTLSSSRPRNY